MLIETVVVGALEVNCYIVVDEASKQALVVDPGADAEKILAALERRGVQVGTIVVTHGHFDHVGGVAEVKRAWPGAPFLAHRQDLFLIEDAAESAARWGFRIEAPPRPDGFLEAGQRLAGGGFELTVLHTPGHSPGGVCLAGEGVVFVGDTLFKGGVGRTDFHQGSFEDLEQSIRTQLYTLPPETVAYPGHGASTTIGEEQRTNPFVRQKATL